MPKKSEMTKERLCIDWEAEPDLDQLRSAYGLLQEDSARAFTVLESLAARGSAMSMIYIGDAFYLGKSVSRDLDQAERWYQQAAASGSLFAHYSLGIIYLAAGRYEDAIRTLRVASSAGCRSATYLLGRAYWDGRKSERDIYLAEQSLERAVELGSVPALRFLGRILIERETSAADSLRGLGLICVAWIKRLVVTAVEGKNSDRLK